MGHYDQWDLWNREMYDDEVRRFLMRNTQRGRQNYLAQNPNQARYYPDMQNVAGMERLTADAVQMLTFQIQHLNYNDRVAAFRNNPDYARHFPHLDPRNANGRQRRGPVLPLSRGLLLSVLRQWQPRELALYMHLAPWLRHQFPEFQPPGGWPDRLFMPYRPHGVALADTVQGPPERYEDWPIQDPRLDPEPNNYVESALRPHPVRWQPTGERGRSPGRQRSPSRTPSPRIHNRAYRRSPPRRHDPEQVETTLTLATPGPRFYQRPINRGPAQYFDPARYRRGDRNSGYIGGAPPELIYHDFDPQGGRLGDVRGIRGTRIPRTDTPVARRAEEDEVDYNRPATWQYPHRGAFDEVWDDNFSPAESALVPVVIPT